VAFRLGDPTRRGTRSGDRFFDLLENREDWEMPGNKTFFGTF